MDDATLLEQQADKMSVGEAAGILRGLRDQYVACFRLTRALQTVMDAESILTNLDHQAGERRQLIDGLKAQHDARLAALNAEYAEAKAHIDAKLVEATDLYNNAVTAANVEINTLRGQIEDLATRAERAREATEKLEATHTAALTKANDELRVVQDATREAQSRLDAIRAELKAMLAPKG